MVKKKLTDGVVSTDPKSARWRSLFASARMAAESGEFRQAANLLTRAMELAKDLPERSYAVNATEMGLGVARLGMGQLREAEDCFNRVMGDLSSAADASERELYAVTLRFYAELLVTKGDERGAEKELQKSITILEDIGPDAGVLLAYSLSDLSGLYVISGRMSEAARYITSAMEILESVFGPENPELVRASMIYRLSIAKDDEEMLDAASDGLMRMEYSFSRNHPDLVRAISRYVEALKARGDEKRLEDVKVRLASFENAMSRKTSGGFR